MEKNRTQQLSQFLGEYINTNFDKDFPILELKVYKAEKNEKKVY